MGADPDPGYLVVTISDQSQVSRPRAIRKGIAALLDNGARMAMPLSNAMKSHLGGGRVIHRLMLPLACKLAMFAPAFSATDGGAINH
jgi:hypothetical protein